jgi:tRNA A37 threonylcarbamoyladenosine biosynthesis protein TsaE
LDDALGPQTITFIEWPQSSAEAVGLLASVPPSFTVEISHRDRRQRELTISNRLNAS